MAEEEIEYDQDAVIRKHRARLSKALWVLIIGMSLFIVAFALYAWKEGANRYQMEGITVEAIRTHKPQTVGDLIKLAAPDHKWTESVVLCPYFAKEQLPDYAKNAVQGVGLQEMYENMNYLVTNGERQLIVRAERKDVDFCGTNSLNSQDSKNLITSETPIKVQFEGNKVLIGKAEK